FVFKLVRRNAPCLRVTRRIAARIARRLAEHSGVEGLEAQWLKRPLIAQCAGGLGLREQEFFEHSVKNRASACARPKEHQDKDRERWRNPSGLHPSRHTSLIAWRRWVFRPWAHTRLDASWGWGAVSEGGGDARPASGPIQGARRRFARENRRRRAPLRGIAAPRERHRGGPPHMPSGIPDVLK